jgi:hypothetical protein
MSTYAMPSVMFGSPGDWDRWFWSTYFDGFLEILHRACFPDGQERWIDREQKRRRLR